MTACTSFLAFFAEQTLAFAVKMHSRPDRWPQIVRFASGRADSLANQRFVNNVEPGAYCAGPVCYPLTQGGSPPKLHLAMVYYVRRCAIKSTTNLKFRRCPMRRELGIARCGLACCLCTENADCNGCDSNGCPDNDFCENKKCSIAKGLTHCYTCEEHCRKGLLGKIKPYAFTLFAKKYGEEKLLDCLERNEKNGVVYHREGINGDYDDFDDVEQLMNFILTGVR